VQLVVKHPAIDAPAQWPDKRESFCKVTVELFALNAVPGVPFDPHVQSMPL
jgi:hypothetical protein